MRKAMVAISMALMAALVAAAASMQQKLATLGFVPVGNTPPEFAARIKSEAVRWDKVIKAAGIRME